MWQLEDQGLHLKRHDLPLNTGKLHSHQMNRFATGTVFIGVAFGFDLIQRLALGLLLYNLEFKQVVVATEVDTHVYLAVTAGIFDSEARSQVSKVAGEFMDASLTCC